MKPEPPFVKIKFIIIRLRKFRSQQIVNDFIICYQKITWGEFFIIVQN